MGLILLDHWWQLLVITFLYRSIHHHHQNQIRNPYMCVVVVMAYLSIHPRHLLIFWGDVKMVVQLVMLYCVVIEEVSMPNS